MKLDERLLNPEIKQEIDERKEELRKKVLEEIEKNGIRTKILDSGKCPDCCVDLERYTCKYENKRAPPFYSTHGYEPRIRCPECLKDYGKWPFKTSKGQTIFQMVSSTNDEQGNPLF